MLYKGEAITCCIPVISRNFNACHFSDIVCFIVLCAIDVRVPIHTRFGYCSRSTCVHHLWNWIIDRLVEIMIAMTSTRNFERRLQDKIM
jgi:hypothetical protein